jgi:hypothetical protein
MHSLVNVSFLSGGHEEMEPNDCTPCQGTQGEGTVLSEARAERTELKEFGTIAERTLVSCGLCNSGPSIGGCGDE